MGILLTESLTLTIIVELKLYSIILVYKYIKIVSKYWKIVSQVFIPILVVEHKIIEKVMSSLHHLECNTTTSKGPR